MVPMRDGVRLATDIYRPAIDGEIVPGRFPTILARTSYDKTTVPMWVTPVAKFFAPHGYVVASRTCAGASSPRAPASTSTPPTRPRARTATTPSSGSRRQPWSNGQDRDGRQLARGDRPAGDGALPPAPPDRDLARRRRRPTSTPTRPARAARWRFQMFGALFNHARDANEIRDDPVAHQLLCDAMEQMGELVLRTPFKPGQTPLRVVPNLEKTAVRLLLPGRVRRVVAARLLRPGAATGTSTPTSPASTAAAGTTPSPSPPPNITSRWRSRTERPQRLLMGPWNHGGIRGDGSTWVGDVDFGPDAKWGDAVYNQHRLRWFDRWLKDVDNGVEDDPPVRIFVMGGGDGHEDARGQAEPRRAVARRAGVAAGADPADDLLPAPRTACSSTEPSGRRRQPGRPTCSIRPIRSRRSAGPCTSFWEMVKLPEGINEAYIPDRGPDAQPGAGGAGPPGRDAGHDRGSAAVPPLATRPDVLVFQTPPLERTSR